MGLILLFICSESQKVDQELSSVHERLASAAPFSFSTRSLVDLRRSLYLQKSVVWLLDFSINFTSDIGSRGLRVSFKNQASIVPLLGKDSRYENISIFMAPNKRVCGMWLRSSGRAWNTT